MNAFVALPTKPNPMPTLAPTVAAALTRRPHRERDFGVGYGNSSGYASSRRYAGTSGQPRFRCV